MEHTDELGGFQLLEIRSSLPDELLMYADKLSMAHGLEARVPYLDRTIVEYAQRLGASHKIRNGSRKWLHRQVCQSYLPARILKRKKRGFAVNVVDGWFRSSLDGKLSEVFSEEQLADVYTAEARAGATASARPPIRPAGQSQALVQSGNARTMVARNTGC